MSTKVIPPKEILEATIGGLSVLVVDGGSTGDVLTLQNDGTYAPVTPSAASGDVVGPASAADNAIVRFDTTTGKLVQNSAATISDTGAICAGAGSKSLPSFCIAPYTSIGMFLRGANLALSAGSVNTFEIQSGAVVLGGVPLNFAGGQNDAVAPSVGIDRASDGVLKVTNASTGLGSLIVGCSTSSTVGFTVKAAASQIANISEWQNNSGTVQTLVSAAGGVTTNSEGVRMNAYNANAGSGTEGRIYLNTSLDFICNRNFSVGLIANPSLGNTYGFGSGASGQYITANGSQRFIASNTDNTFTPHNAANVALTVKAAASQSANLQEWQNNSGTAGAAVDKNCGCYFDYLGVGPGFCVDAVNHRVGIGTGAPAYKLHVVTPGAAGFKVQTTGGSIASPSLDFVDSTNGVELILAPNGANCAIGTYSNHPVQIVSNQQVGATVTATSTVFAGTVCANTYTVATLPSASANAYKFANVSDSLAPVIGNTVAAGGSAKAMVWSDGTNWKVCAA